MVVDREEASEAVEPRAGGRRRRLLTAADIMRSPVMTAPPDTPVSEARLLLAEAGVRHLPVLEDELLVGIVSERDLLRAPSQALPVAAVMTCPVFVATPGTPLKRLAWLLRRRRVGAVPVLDGRRLVGIVSVVDVLRAVAAEPGG